MHTAGYHIVTPAAANDGLLQQICAQTDQMHTQTKLGDDAIVRPRNVNANDLFRQIPAFDILLRDPAIQGAITSLAGDDCRLEVHRASHYLSSGAQHFFYSICFA